MITLSGLKTGLSDREKVLEWLRRIGETDPDCIAEVIEQCSSSKEARDYYLSRYEEK